MKIVKPGTLRKADTAWWAGEKATCSNCGAIVQLDADDTPDWVLKPITIFGIVSVLFDCPFCMEGQGLMVSIDDRSLEE